MKLGGRILKVFVILTLASAVLVFMTATAIGRNGPHEGPGMPQDTDACAGCHRAHTGVAANLLTEAGTVYDFCTSCHNGTGANTNVLDGWFGGQGAANPATPNTSTPSDKFYGTEGDGDPGKGLNGGGFDKAMTYDGRSGRNTGWGNVTSKHDTEVDAVAWGGGSTGPGTDFKLDLISGEDKRLKCTGCHDPHGTVNDDNGDGEYESTESERYRILQTTVNGVDIGAVKITSNEIAEWGKRDYTKDAYKSTGISTFCAACHTQYTTKASIYDAGDGEGSVERIRHTIDVALDNGKLLTGNGLEMHVNLNSNTKLPVSQATGYNALHTKDDKVVCLTCHQAHGTNSTMTAPIKDIEPSKSSLTAGAEKSTLLRLNNRGVCQDCHQK
ncbi:MAG: hypothetical protein E3J54_02655 [Actinobacteria bacterium]|nr:MAG: hypothetical protein E3J54_02655 [Actinomycetota bacterium]